MSVVANVAINVDSRNAVSKLRQVEQASSKLDQTYKDLNGRLRDANGKFIKAGDAAQAASGKVNILGNAVKNLAAQLVVADLARRFFKGFDEAEKAAAAVRTLGVDSKALEGQLLSVSNRLGGLYSQTQLLAASYDVASAGFANAADNAKILEASAKGATGGLSDINTVADAVTSVLNTYGKSAAEAGALVDGFIQTQNDGKITLNQYAEQIGKLAPTAAAAGVGIQELNAAVATITPQGVQVEAAVAGLNQALVAILKPSKEASDLAEALGIDFNEAGLRAKGFGGLLQEVKEKTGGSTTALVQLFGSVDALKAVLPLVNDDLVKYNQNVQRQAEVSGVADRATQELGGTVSAEVSKMVNQIGNLTRSLDTVLGPALGGIVRLINVVIAEATKGINVLGQLFSLSKNTAILKGALQAGDIGSAAASRALPGIDELIGEKRRKQLAVQAGAGSGFLGIGGLSTKKFTELLKKEPAIQKLLGPTGATPAVGGTATRVDPAIQATLDSLGESGSKGKKGKSDAEKAAEKAARIQAQVQGLQRQTELTKQLTFLQEQIANAEAVRDQQLVIRLQGEEKLLQLQYQLADALADAETAGQRKAAFADAEAKADQIRVGTAIELSKNEEERQKRFEELLTGLDREIELNGIKEEAAKKLKQIEFDIIDFRKQGILLTDAEADAYRRRAQAAAATEVKGPAQQRMEELQKSLATLTNQEQIAVAVADNIGQAFGNAFQDIITGAASGQEALANMMKSIGENFVNMAAQIIAQQMTMIILGTIMKALGLTGGLGSMGGGGGGLGSLDANLAKYAPLEGPGFTPFAEGGFVTGPTQALIGEAGESEYVIPASKMSGAMARYSAGARGNAVIPAEGDEGISSMSIGAPTGAIDVRYSVERINSVDYVTADQFQRGMAQAAQQGAKQGEQMTLRRLQQSRSTRGRLGLN